MLYACMGTAAWRVWNRGGFTGQTAPLAMYAAQLALNLAWPPLFFKAHKLGTAAVESTGMFSGGCTNVLFSPTQRLDPWQLLAALLCTAAATAKLFGEVDATASYLMFPYIVWLSYATALSAWIWNANPRAGSTAELKMQPRTTKAEEIKRHLQQ